MSFPDLTPTSTVSAITLPETSSDVDGDITSSLAVGFYTDAAFILGAKAQVAYTYKRLGGDVLDIEITAKNVYNHYEEACLEYSYIVNLHQARNALGSALGGPTGSFDNKGALTGVRMMLPESILSFSLICIQKCRQVFIRSISWRDRTFILCIL